MNKVERQLSLTIPFEFVTAAPDIPHVFKSRCRSKVVKTLPNLFRLSLAVAFNQESERRAFLTESIGIEGYLHPLNASSIH